MVIFILKIISSKTYIFWNRCAISANRPKCNSKNASTSRAHNFFKNGRTRLVYASVWSQGPPRLQKTGLGWFPRLARPLRPDLRNFSIFFQKLSHPAIFPRFPEFWKICEPKFQSVVKTLKTMFLTQKPKFPTARDLTNISQKIITRKNNFTQKIDYATYIWALNHRFAGKCRFFQKYC